MSATATRPETSYLLRKLHSLSGIVPVGAFLAEHFWSNSAALVSAEKYNQTSVELQTIPFRVFVEWAFIFFPILFHGGGVVCNCVLPVVARVHHNFGVNQCWT